MTIARLRYENRERVCLGREASGVEPAIFQAGLEDVPFALVLAALRALSLLGSKLADDLKLLFGYRLD